MLRVVAEESSRAELAAGLDEIVPRRCPADAAAALEAEVDAAAVPGRKAESEFGISEHDGREDSELSYGGPDVEPLSLDPPPEFA
jgi:hypothetical protein